MSYCDHSNQEKFPFTLPNLPYKKDAFEPHFSSENFNYHHGMHHNAYVTNLNNLIPNNKELLGLNLEQIIKTSHNVDSAILTKLT